MKFTISIYVILILVLHIPLMSAADEEILTEEEFLHRVLSYHPLSKSASLLDEEAAAYLRSARGGFDPRLQGNYYTKEFKGAEYYTLPEAELIIPTLAGIDIRAGWMNGSGDYLNPQNTFPDQGLLQLGLDLPIGKGLFTDERRNHLRKAQIFIDLNTSERINALNDLLLDASSYYWKWYRSWRYTKILSKAHELAKERFGQIRESHRLGDLAAIDTLEAYTQVQYRKLELMQAEQDLIITRWQISQFIWDENGTPLFLGPETSPHIDSADLDIRFGQFTSTSVSWTDSLADHPSLRIAALKMEQTEQDIRYWKEQLKPRLDLSYNAIIGRQEFRDEGISGADPLNDYTFGLKASIPLFLRKERGNLKMARIDLQQSEYEFQNKRQKISNSLAGEIASISLSYEILKLRRLNSTNYNTLLKAETTKFRTGESSLFVVNMRESNYINALVKEADSEAKIMYQLRLISWWIGNSQEGQL
jgi:outer membrane protein TolC